MTVQAQSRREALIAEHEALQERLTRKAEGSLHSFITQAWHIVEPSTPFIDNWHIEAKCLHLTALHAGTLGRQNLLINEPPGFSKSLVVSVFFPAWIWTRMASFRVLCASFDQTLSTRDNWRMRQLVESEWYRSRWPGVQLATDQNQKTFYRTTDGGWRLGTSFGSRIAGEHPNGKIIDDPHDTKKQILSEADIRTAVEYYQSGLKPRGSVMGAWSVLLMQRIHQHDLTGWVLEHERDEWYMLCLPMRWEPKRMIVLPPLNWRDPREGQPGALLDPRRFPEAEVNRHYPPGSWVDAAQCQQQPVPVGGLMFKRDQFQIIHARPSNIIGTVRSWDMAGTPEAHRTTTSARTVGLRMERTEDGLFIVTDIRKGWWSSYEVEQQMRQAAHLDGALVPIREEREGGSSGLAVIAAHRRLLAGYNYGEVKPQTNKVQRALAMQAQAQGGNMRILVPMHPDGTLDEAAQQMAKEFLDEIEMFPAGTLKDQIDAATQAFNVLTDTASSPLDILTGTEPASTAEREEDVRAYLREQGLDPDTVDPEDVGGIEDLLS